MVSSPLRAILLLSFSSPSRGIPLYFTGTGSVRGDGSSKRLSFEESRNVALLMFTCIRMLLILIYVLYKSKSLTLVTIGYSWIHSWDIFIEHCFWAQEAVCNKVIDVGTGFMKILYLGRAPRTKETLPDFREKCRVTRHSRAFRGLTGSQRTPGFWGVTKLTSCSTVPSSSPSGSAHYATLLHFPLSFPSLPFLSSSFFLSFLLPFHFSFLPVSIFFSLLF